MSEIDEAAKIIDRLLTLLPHHDYNAVDDAIAWLQKNAGDDLFLSVASRDEMERKERTTRQ